MVTAPVLHSRHASCVATVVPHVDRMRLLELHGRTGAGCSWLRVLLAALFEGDGSLLPAGLIIAQ